MSSVFRIYVDECLPISIFKKLKKVMDLLDSKRSIELTSIPDRFGPGCLDSIWVPQLNPKNGIVITGDRGRKKTGDKLPELCLARGLKVLIVAPKLRDRGLHGMLRAIVNCWDGVFCAIDESDCMIYRLEAQDNTTKTIVDPVRYSLHRKPMSRCG